ncbi:uncharacterized protein CIMG_02811 [Coccidioides immitis RS]|uniref:LysM domain-containing protein n=4 Tax=Coccidioides immitis TaxID=5501 RepID=J3KM60_COCIM|nr:uncharacterized protein CIMG_02811 [Coccidioides immitis RS]KMP02286.1 hypothetical protein CIRG_10109 [Coccidioides immitis RMSCC 2394]KMU79382.1 hypothetical protein CISG_07786 [Coccidioides immitis RMSCC 3703]KMU90085.1 hypothetical protein CIHG_07895 [Coccidioides immitis H538.4]TPX24652.1 hypothetical protein DIZ76_010084 [Coccidioides immitis]EAS37457.3 hypothetical protein CIMG_02811 [Coccidioides immitis RS]
MYWPILVQALVLSAGAVEVPFDTGTKPTGVVDPRTTKQCQLWVNKITDSNACPTIVKYFSLKQSEFSLWNPGVDYDCRGFKKGNSYCVKAPIWRAPAKRALPPGVGVSIPPLSKRSPTPSTLIVSALPRSLSSTTEVTFSLGLPSQSPTKARPTALVKKAPDTTPLSILPPTPAKRSESMPLSILPPTPVKRSESMPLSILPPTPVKRSESTPLSILPVSGGQEPSALPVTPAKRSESMPLSILPPTPAKRSESMPLSILPVTPRHEPSATMSSNPAAKRSSAPVSPPPPSATGPSTGLPNRLIHPGTKTDCKEDHLVKQTDLCD